MTDPSFDDLADIREELTKLLEQQRELRMSDPVNPEQRDAALSRNLREVERLTALLA